MKRIQIVAKDHYELGLLYGKQARTEIGQMIDMVSKCLQDKFGFIGEAINFFLLPFTPLIKKKFGPTLIAEMRGIAEGSGQSTDWIYLLNSTYEIGCIFNRYLKFMGCSAFVFPKKDMESVIIGKTTDFIQKEEFTRSLIKLRLFLSYQVGGSGLIDTVIFPGQVASDFAVLDKKIFIGFNDGGMTTKHTDFSKASIIPVICRLFERKQSVAEIKEGLKDLRVIHPFIVVISNGTIKNTFTADIMPNGVKIIEMKDSIIRTNFLQDEADRDYYYGKDWASDKFFLSAFFRYEAIKESAKKHIDMDEAKRLLRLHEADHDYFSGSVNNQATANALVWNGRTGKLLIPEYDNKFPLLDSDKWEMYE